MPHNDDFENISPLMDDCLRNADMTLARLTAMSDVDHAQKAYIEAIGEFFQLSFNFLDAVCRVSESLARKLNQVN